MKTYKYLYDSEKTELPSMDIGLKARIKAAKELLNKLQEISFLERDDTRIEAVLEAIKHNETLLDGEL